MGPLRDAQGSFTWRAVLLLIAAVIGLLMAFSPGAPRGGAAAAGGSALGSLDNKPVDHGSSFGVHGLRSTGEADTRGAVQEVRAAPAAEPPALGGAAPHELAPVHSGWSWRRHVPAGSMQYYKLHLCSTCSAEDEAKYLCKDDHGHMMERIAAASRGMVRPHDRQWNLLWMCTPSQWNNLKPWALEHGLEEGRFHRDELAPGQKVNFVPGVRTEVYPKTTFCSHLRSFWGVEAMSKFTPPCFVLPEDLKSLMDVQAAFKERSARRSIGQGIDLEDAAAEEGEAVGESVGAESLVGGLGAVIKGLRWFVKEAESSYGKGVRMHVGELTESQLRHVDVVQAEVFPPALLANRKFDFRVYALVPSFDPYRVYLYTRSYSRRAYVDYTPDPKVDLAHITNTKYQVAWARARNKPQSVIDSMLAPRGNLEGSHQYTKWSLRASLRQLAKETGVEQRELWRRLRASVARTLAAVAPTLSCRREAGGKRPYPCGTAFQLFGVDIMWRVGGVPFVIEANTQPGFTNTGTFMWQLHVELIGDVLSVVGMMPDAPQHVDVDVLRERLRAVAANDEERDAVASLTQEQWGQLATMLREFATSGQFDLAFPDPRWDWQPTARKLYQADMPVYLAFTRAVQTPGLVDAVVSHWHPDYREHLH